MATSLITVSDCKTVLDNMGWAFRAKHGTTGYEFERKPRRGRAPKQRYALMSLSQLRKAAETGALDKTTLRADPITAAGPAI